MKYYIEFENKNVVAIHSAKPEGVETIEVDESEIEKYLIRNKKERENGKYN